MLASFFGVVRCVRIVAVRDLGMVTGFFVISRGVMLRRCAMMLGSVLVVLSRFHMVFFTFFRHALNLFLRYGARNGRSRTEDTPAP